MTKYVCTAFILLIGICSCQKNMDEAKKIEELLKENRMLKDSLKFNYKKIVESDFILDPQLLYFKLGKANTITCYISEQKELPQYDVYLTDEKYNFKPEDKLHLKNKKGNKFEFDYVPKKLTDEVVRIAAVFKLDTLTVQLNGRTDLPVK